MEHRTQVCVCPCVCVLEINEREMCANVLAYKPYHRLSHIGTVRQSPSVINTSTAKQLSTNTGESSASGHSVKTTSHYAPRDADLFCKYLINHWSHHLQSSKHFNFKRTRIKSFKRSWFRRTERLPYRNRNAGQKTWITRGVEEWIKEQMMLIDSIVTAIHTWFSPSTEWLSTWL